MDVKVLSPENPVASLGCKSVTAPGVEGYFCVLPNHVDFISEVSIGELSLVKDDGSLLKFFMSGGYVEVDDNVVTVLASVIESSSDIDIDRAEKARERAVNRLDKCDPEIDLLRAQAALKRAQMRLDVVAVG